MRWAEVWIRASEGEQELVSALVNTRMTAGVSMEEDGEGVVVKGYLPADANLDTLLEGIRERLFVLAGLAVDPPSITVRFVNDSQWIGDWRAGFGVRKVGERIVVCPRWLAGTCDLEPGQVPVFVEPGLAFGPGEHASTLLALRGIDAFVKGQRVAYDVGTGSGILAVAMARLGVERVLATDIDDLACQVASEHVAFNGQEERVVVQKNDLLEGLDAFEGRRPEIIVANILAHVILRMTADAYRILKPGGIFISSGITEKRCALVERGLAGAGFQVTDSFRDGPWRSLVGRKEG